jgi:hypothetical protein
LVEAFVAEGSGWEVDFSAVGAFACHELALFEELVELVDGEGRFGVGHGWLLL